MGGKKSGKNRKGKEEMEPNTRIYFKVLATFECSNERCRKCWHSAHGWNREKIEGEGGTECESCGRNCELQNAVEEMLQLDSYRCLNQACNGNSWQSIHIGELYPQECDICERMVNPEPHPQERFGCHYWFKCTNRACSAPQEWEDFSLNALPGQRCTKCHSRGNLKKTSKLKKRPPFLDRRQRDGKRGGGGGGGDAEQLRPTTHIAEYCDMCQNIRRQGKGRSCHAFRKVKTQVATTPDGGVTEVIVGASTTQ